METKVLIKIKHSNGAASKSILLDVNHPLSDIRTTLVGREIMGENDLFVFDDSEISSSDEKDVILANIVANNTLCIGHSKSEKINEDSEVMDWRFLSDSQRFDLLSKCQLNKGIILSAKDGITKTFGELFSWKVLPQMLVPRKNTEEISAYSFSKVTRDLNLISSNRSSLSLDAPFVSVEADYKQSKSQATSSSEVTEYMVQKYIVSKASFEIAPEDLVINSNFAKAVNDALAKGDSEKDKLCYLLHALNTWGMYIPLKFTLGGALYSFEKTKIADYSQAEKEEKDFSISAKAAYAGYSGVANYGSSSSGSSSSSTSNKYKNLVINQIGGKPGQTQDKAFLAKSLSNAMYWEIVDIEIFYPSLMLLNNYENSSVDADLLVKCLDLMNKNYYHQAVKNIQPIIDIHKYATSIEGLLLPW